jgi:RNA polymerase sigma-70 factor (sigma-E family)
VHEAEEELERLYHQHYSGLVRLALLLVRDVQSAEEVVQDAFVGLYTGWGRLRHPDRAAMYLRRGVVNGCRTRLRRRGVEIRHQQRQQGELLTAEPPGNSPESAGIAVMTRRAVLDAVAELPRRQREVFFLRYYLDLSETEIADTLAISRGAVKSHASRAAATLRQSLLGLDR